jgi:catechol 2,3-dioxygenase-like lactoylglutathione lyase family enzyme
LVSGTAVLEYTGIRVRDLERSRGFYTAGLGLVAGRTGRMAAGGVWQELIDPESHAVLELNFYPDQPPYREGDELDHLGFRVQDLDGTVRRLTGLGARIRIPPFRDGEERLAFLSDPDGVWIELSESSGPDSPPTSLSVE